jgi:nitrite reductase/ring-hydroxylating ferredoxin subunit
LKTGVVLGGPAQKNLCVYPVRVEDGDVFVSLDAARDLPDAVES